MRIALNLLYLLPGLVGGTETYAAGLLEGLSEVGGDHEFLMLVNRQGASWPLPEAANIRREVCPVSGPNQAARYGFRQLRLPGLLRKHGVDVVHSLGYVSPLVTPCPRVVTKLAANGDLPATRRRQTACKMSIARAENRQCGSA
jgi:hypothetical protein